MRADFARLDPALRKRLTYVRGMACMCTERIHETFHEYARARMRGDHALMRALLDERAGLIARRHALQREECAILSRSMLRVVGPHCRGIPRTP
jgi:hypothetical protein